MKIFFILAMSALTNAVSAEAETLIQGDTTIYRSQAASEFDIAAVPGAYFLTVPTLNSFKACDGDGQCSRQPFNQGACVLSSKVKAMSAGPATVTIGIRYSTFGNIEDFSVSAARLHQLFRVRVTYVELINGSWVDQLVEEEYNLGNISVYELAPSENAGRTIYRFASEGRKAISYHEGSGIHIAHGFKNLTVSLCGVTGGITAIYGVDATVLEDI